MDTNKRYFHRRSSKNNTPSALMNIICSILHHIGNYKLPSKQKILSLCCFAIIVFGTRNLFSSPSKRRGEKLEAGHYHTRRERITSTNISETDKCWLRHAIKNREFKLFSHRSYFDNTQEQQPSCHDSLLQLKTMGVNHIDLDLILAERSESEVNSSSNPHRHKLVVAHPMEFKHESNYFSPCANFDLDEFVQTLKQVYGPENFFLSMEPKAAWGHTQKELDDVALANSPAEILELLVLKIRELELREKCAVILPNMEERHRVGLEEYHDIQKERSLIKVITTHCEIYRGIRLSEDAPEKMGEDIDKIMPTIEFHPNHPHNTDGKSIQDESLLRKSIFWVVDNEADLTLAAELKPFGIVSNTPKNIVDIVKSSSWCSTDI